MNFARFALPLGALAYLPLACSSDVGPDKTIPGPPGNTTFAMGGSGGAPVGGSGGSMTAGGTGAGTAGTGGTGGATGGSGGSAEDNGMACAKTGECPVGGFVCKSNVCTCSNDKPSICGTGATAVCTNKMIDPDHCGDCDTKCDAGATCVAGKCGAKPTMVATATGCGGGVRMATDGKNLYWLESAGKIRSVPVGGGTIADVATGQMKPTQIAVDSSGVYWANQGADGKTGTIVKKALDAAPGDAPTLLVTGMGTQDPNKGKAVALPALTVQKGMVYYSETSVVHQVTLDAQDKVTKDIMVGIAVNYDNGGMVVEGTPVGLAASDAFVVWTSPLDRGGVESHKIEAVTNATDNKPGYGKLGKSVGALLPAGAVVLDAKNGYWLDGGKVEFGPLTSTEGLYDVVTQVSGTFTALALAGTKLYLADDSGKVYAHGVAPVAGEDGPSPIARDQMGVSSITTDATNVYWITDDCVISKLPL
ncbi:MAG TPA: hypothetical protein VHB79_13430 [Polyangiaceae bacterium]|nr:hypothetical protein [Polyangiaceae bacterium]